MFQHEEHVEYRLGSFQSLSLISLGNVSYFWMFVAAGVCSFQLCICTPVHQSSAADQRVCLNFYFRRSGFIT